MLPTELGAMPRCWGAAPEIPREAGTVGHSRHRTSEGEAQDGASTRVGRRVQRLMSGAASLFIAGGGRTPGSNLCRPFHGLEIFLLCYPGFRCASPWAICCRLLPQAG